MIKPSPELAELCSRFNTHGYNLWFVGGCVRDSLMGETPKDIDLCTDADPTQQILIYGPYGYKHFLTGLQHGTITVRVGEESYEVTSLRTETDHDGRRATVSYTRDLKEDLSRRDLTINSMAQTMDGEIVDPFGGQDDLNNNRVRFVGDAEERMKEDYLRILRFFRFHGRFSRGSPFDADALDAIIETKRGLTGISGERIWLEMSKILVGPLSAHIVQTMRRVGVADIIGLNDINIFALGDTWMSKLTRPAVVLGLIFTSSENLEETMGRWKLAKSERAEARYGFSSRNKIKLREFKDDLVDGSDIEHVEEMLKYHQLPSLRKWDVPIFPVTGADLINIGFCQGPELGEHLKVLREVWKKSKYTLKKNQLIT